MNLLENPEKSKAKNENQKKLSIATQETIENSTIDSNCDISGKGALTGIDFMKH